MRNLLLTASIILCACLHTACKPAGAKQDGSINIVATSFPEYDWIRQILGDNPKQIELSYLLAQGGDLHNYQPTVRDIVSIGDADLFVHNGGASEAWVNDIIQQRRQGQPTINLMDSLGLHSECSTHCSHEHGHEHSHCSHEHGHEHSHELQAFSEQQATADEHIWLSPKKAIQLCETLEEQLSQLDPEHAELYEQNKQNYIAQLKELDARYQASVDQSQHTPLIIADRFPFYHLMKDYGIKYYAAYSGCSAEAEASFKLINTMSNTLKKINTPYIFILKGGMRPIATSIIANSGCINCKIVELNSIENVGEEQRKQGTTYLQLMEENRQQIETALGK